MLLFYVCSDRNILAKRVSLTLPMLVARQGEPGQGGGGKLDPGKSPGFYGRQFRSLPCSIVKYYDLRRVYGQTA